MLLAQHMTLWLTVARSRWLLSLGVCKWVYIRTKGLRSFKSPGQGHEVFHKPCRNSNDSKDGDKTAQHTPNNASAAHDVVVNRCEKPLTAWPRGLQIAHQNKGLRPFKSREKGQGVFHNPCSIAVNEKTGYIVVAEGLSPSVQLFDSEWKFLRTRGDKGTGAKIKGNPISVAFTSSGNIMWCWIIATK